MPAARLSQGLSREERIGLAIAVLLHVALVAWLALDRLGKEVQPPPERMTVSLAEEVAPQATSPEPLAQAAPDLAPTLGEAAPEPIPTAEPRLAPAPRPSVAASRTPPKVAPAATPQPRQRPDKPSGASRIGSDFLKGVGGDARGTSQNAPAARAGPQVAASLSQAISRQLKPHWSAPQGVEADQLVTVLSFDLNEDGTLAGRPRVVSQSGVTDANRAQKARHAEQAIRSVQLAAPFDLPAKYYSLWKHVASFRFDRRLSQ
jgi:hypothetical protein